MRQRGRFGDHFPRMEVMRDRCTEHQSDSKSDQHDVGVGFHKLQRVLAIEQGAQRNTDDTAQRNGNQ